VIPSNSWVYVSIDITAERSRELRALSYTEFLRTDYWQAVRLLVCDRAGWKCHRCRTNQRLTAHHKTYRHHGREHKHLNDLQCLCESCHVAVRLVNVATFPRRYKRRREWAPTDYKKQSRRYGVKWAQK
jgi:hypothetical protein